MSRDNRVFVGNLPLDIRERELDDLFYKYGRIRDIVIKKPSNPPAYAFITYSDHRDAEEAVYRRDGYEFAGRRIRVELSKARNDDRDGGRRGDGNNSRGDNNRGGDNRSRIRSMKNGIIINNLPDHCTWQDIKDYCRKAGDVTFADIKGGVGYVDYSNKEDQENAVRTLDDSEFKSERIKVKLDEKVESNSSSSGGDASGGADGGSSSTGNDHGNDKSNDDRRSRSRERSRSRSRSNRSN